MNDIYLFVIGCGLLYWIIQYYPYQTTITETFLSLPTASFFNFFDEIYCRLYEKVFSADEIYQKECSLIFNKLAEYGKSTWNHGVELGSGTGRQTQFLRKGGPLLCVDAVSHMNQLAQVRNPELNFLTADFRRPGLVPPATIDVVFLLEETLYLNHPTEQVIVLNEIRKWLKPGGILVLTVWDISNLDPSPREFSQFMKDTNPRHSVTYYEKLQHESWFLPQPTVGPGVFDYEERYTLELENGTIKKKEEHHRLYFPPNRKTMMALLKQWKLIATINFSSIGINNREIFFLQ